MTSFISFVEMEVWQTSRELVRRVRSICKTSKAQYDFAFVDQVTRAARSVSANIAEGCESLSQRDFVRFLGYAKASVAEVHSHLFDALDEEYITKEEFEELALLTKQIGKMIASLINYLRKITRS